MNATIIIRISALALLTLPLTVAAQNGASSAFAAGMDEVGGSVRLFSRLGSILHDIAPYGTGFTGGVRVAVGDVNGDGTPDLITAAGPGAGPHVLVFDGVTGVMLRAWTAFDPAFTGGVYVAAGDVDADGTVDIIVSPGPGGGPHVRVFSGRSGAVLHEFLAYDPAFLGGVVVAAGDVDGDLHADIITAPASTAGPHVKVFSGNSGSQLRSFLAFEPTFTGGVYVASGDFNGDGIEDILAGSGPGGGPHVKVFDGASLDELASFFAYTPSFTGGVRVATGDINDDGFADIITAPGPGGPPQIALFLGPDAETGETGFAFDPNFTGGVFVAGQPSVPTIFRSGFELEP